MKNTILFDLDGTLIDSAEGIIGSVRYALSKMEAEVPDRAALLPFVGPPLKESFMEFSGFTEAQALEAQGFYRENFAAVGIYQAEVYEGIPQMLDALLAAGKKLVLATSKPIVFSEKIMEHFGLASRFSLLCGSEFDGTRVHKGELVAYALEKSGTDPAAAVMVGDRKFDIQGANVNHIDSVGVLYGFGSREEFRKEGAGHIVRDVAELERLLLAL